MTSHLGKCSRWKGVYVEKIQLKKEYNRPMANTKMKIKEDEAYEKLLKNEKIEEDSNHIFYVEN